METSPALRRAGERLRMKRQLIGIPLAELAVLVGATPEVLRAIEAGSYDPRSLPLTAQQRLSHWLDAPL